MKKINRKWINDQINQGKPVQVACIYSNVCRWNFLTTSGNVTREEFGFQDDTPTDQDEQVFTLDLPVMSWASVKRLQRALANYGKV